jgi:plastocyanin
MQLGLRRAALLALIVVACAACLASCQERSSSPVVTINILGGRGSHSYNPGNIVVNLGTLVTWVNQDSQPHSATAPGAFDSGMIAPNGGKWTWVAAMQGTFTYTSLTDPSMSGTITVVAQPPS